MKHFVITTTLALYLASAVNMASAQKVLTDHYSSAKYDCVIFPGTYPSDVDGTPFTATHDQVDKAQKMVTDNLKNVKCNKKEDRDEVVKNLGKYKMQVFGYTDKLGNKILLLSCFRGDYKDKDLSSTWLSDMIMVESGGTYFWSVKYDLNKNELFEFKVSGNG